MENDLNKAYQVLKSGGIILYPTDTIWGIGCDATNKRAVEKVFKLKGRSKDNPFLILVDKISRLKEYVEDIPEIHWDLLRNLDKPTTVIYPKAKNLPKNVIGPGGSVAIRVVKDEFCSRLIDKFSKPIISTSANYTGEEPAIVYRDVADGIRDGVDYIVEMFRDEYKEVKPSTLLKLLPDGNFEVIRP